ncbi:acyltransferase family protein [Stutzerimonas urumqiensis]|uniref:acyltransferase family protein n=1 Tax=Stutzerimonas urumqiensis TaxID=638269 RepID=UPI000EB3521C|nr:acyltransferase family protein [Stutzerimonas urumqiensis]
MTSTTHTPHVGNRYYPYIDGLRAFAVLSVLIFHLHAPWLPGGFVGVDVFFVISGFVVSASVANFKGGGLLPLLGFFYARRIKRIFPALIVCLLATAYLSALFVPAIWLSEVNQQTGLYAFFGLSNFILAQTGRDYFAPTTEFNPYTHTWSLAVEEQFYLVFPFLFIAWLAGRRGKWLSVGLFVAGLVASLGYAAWQSQAGPTQAYFLTPSRFWELAAGVLLYQVVALSPRRPGSNGTFGALIGLASLALLAVAFAVSSSQGFPFPWALPAVLGTLGLIYSLHDCPEHRHLHGLIGSRPLVAIGKISYSLYLWHWPVFVLFRWTLGLDTPGLRLLAVALAFLLAVLSYRLVENPVRESRHLRQAPQAAIVFCGLLIVSGAWWSARAIDRLQPAISLTSVSQSPADWYPNQVSAEGASTGCVADPEYHPVEGGVLMLYVPKHCTEPKTLSDSTLYVIGDSHAMAYEAMFEAYAIEHAVRIKAYVKSGCAFISLQPWNDNAECRRFVDRVLGEIETLQPGDVLFLPSLRLPRLSSQWAAIDPEQAYAHMFGPEADAGRQRIVADTVTVLSRFTDQGVRVVFEAPKPIFKSPPFRCADWFNRMNPVCEGGFQMPKAELQALRAPVLAAFDEVQRRLPGVATWDPFPVLCPNETCSAWDGGKPLFLDGDHLSGHGNRQLVDSFSRFMAADERQARNP